jgi:hypothetical protein
MSEHPLRRNLAWLLVTAAHLFVFPYYGRINNPNENARVWTTKSLVDHHTFALEAVEQEWGFVDDKAIAGGRVYSSKAPGPSLLGVPIYFVQAQLWRLLGRPPPSPRALTLALRMFGVALPLGLFFWAFSRYMQGLTGSRTGRDLLVVGLGLGSLLYPYGVIFVGHALGGALAFLSFMLLTPVTGAPASREARFAAGFAAAAAVVFEYHVGAAVAALAAYGLFRYRRGVGWMLLGAVPPTFVLALFHDQVYGKPWAMPWSHMQNAGFAVYHAQGFMGFTPPRPSAIAAMLFAPDLGLFVFSPFLLAGVAASVYAAIVSRGHRGRVLGALGACTATLLFISSMSFWRGGWCAGPRYITVVAPFLAYGVALGWKRIARSFWASAVLVGLVIVSVFMNGISAALYPHYPPQLDNPVFDLAIPLLRDGFVPYGIGWLAGLPRLWSLAPLGLLVLGALALVAGGEGRSPGRRALHAACAAAVAVLLVLPFSRYGREPNGAEAWAMHFVEGTWEPAPRVSAPAAPHNQQTAR